LGSLIPAGDGNSPRNQKENVFYVEVNKIKPNPNQPRRDFDEESIADLARSVRRYGILQPLLVAKIEDNSPRGLDVSYILLAGERRLRAAQKAGLPHVPVIIRDDFNEDKTRLEVALTENIQREDLNAIEQAEAYLKLQKEYGLTQQEIGEKVSKSRVAVANIIRLLSLPEDMKQAVKDGKIGYSSARGLLAFSDANQQRLAFDKLISGAVSKDDLEKMASQAKKNPKTRNEGRFLELEKNLSRTLQTPVAIHAGAGGGRIVVRFATLEDLNKIAKSIID